MSMVEPMSSAQTRMDVLCQLGYGGINGRVPRQQSRSEGTIRGRQQSLPLCHRGISDPRRRHFGPFVRTKSGASALVRLSGGLGKGTRKVPEDGDGMSSTTTTRSVGEVTTPI